MLERLTRRQLFLTGAAAAFAFAGLFAAIVGGGIVYLGWYDVSADKPHGQLISWAVHTTMIHAVRARAHDGIPPKPFSEVQIRDGFDLYEDHCAVCHGGPGVARAKWVRGLEPTPPYLLDAARRWSPAELRFIIKHGVKMTAMPAWGRSHSDADITSLMAFLEALPSLTPKAYQAMHDQRTRGKPSRNDAAALAP